MSVHFLAIQFYRWESIFFFATPVALLNCCTITVNSIQWNPHVFHEGAILLLVLDPVRFTLLEKRTESFLTLLGYTQLRNLTTYITISVSSSYFSRHLSITKLFIKTFPNKHSYSRYETYSLVSICGVEFTWKINRLEAWTACGELLHI